MTDIVLRDIDPVLAERIKRISDKRGVSLSQTLFELLEHGLHAYEGDGTVRFDTSEDDVLQAAIAAMEGVPSDPGFALIGRASPLAEEPQAG
jgi:hypothetical protein